jgi:hypothetical protein
LTEYIKYIYNSKDYLFPKDALCLLCGDFNVDANNFIDYKSNVKDFDPVDEYKLMMDYFSQIGEVRDVYYYQHKEHPITYGQFGEEAEVILTIPHDVGCRLSLDYIFELRPFVKGLIRNDKQSQIEKTNTKETEITDEITNTRQNLDVQKSITQINDSMLIINNKQNETIYTNKKEVKIVYDTIKIEKFFVKRKPYTQLSDHYGVSVELEYI